MQNQSNYLEWLGVCPFQGTPFYGKQHIEGQLQLPTRELDLHCLVKTVYTIKQQKYPTCGKAWTDIEGYWNEVARAFPSFQNLLNSADACDYDGLKTKFEEMWY